ncbi:hypothetical protein TSUD_322930 [Trifolium subterraneum]|uniref:Uncharacterized protein n=1 Tax=Trifolium subterraneum TaxID=3900 RepID=A0A2Z6MMK6_TRISU|nr:hypothetical protein TSUD_322930 [Trifolium subterraneum]
MFFLQLKSNGNEEASQTECCAGLHLQLVESVTRENNWHNNFAKRSEEKPNEQFIAPEDGSDVDPFAELESMLMGGSNFSPKSTCSTSNVALSKALRNLECLLNKSLKSILCDVELQQQLHASLECIGQASHEKVSPNVVKLVQKMTLSIKNLFEDFVMTERVVEDHSNALKQREKIMQLVRDGKNQMESLQKEKIQFGDKAKHLEEEGEKLKESMERCEGEKKKVADEAKNMITETKELMSMINNSKPLYDIALSNQQKLKDNWKSFGTAFANNYGSS